MLPDPGIIDSRDQAHHHHVDHRARLDLRALRPPLLNMGLTMSASCSSTQRRILGCNTLLLWFAIASVAVAETVDETDRSPAMAERRDPPALHGTAPTLTCNTCHGWRANDLRQRPLNQPHADLSLRHGAARLWCLDCHHDDDYEMLSLSGSPSTPASLDRTDALCATCHADRVRDWRAGAHGKHLGSWLKPPVQSRCSSCHDAHAPAVQSMTPSPIDSNHDTKITPLSNKE
ncbi:MAG: hypothetical protein HQL50_06815 [Magnetococcales bacterium]|nr:hypothetical protein [Magnetococcales bacterium]